ncbi:MAG: GtrA family protein [Campylobacterota bacterium]|nr:GtrA family protein [Campylobacterota bacterium]
MRSFLTFGIVGSVGFIADASILLYLVEILNTNITPARFISFICAVFVTWILNRYFTFSDSEKKYKKHKEYFIYLTIQSIGALINFTVFFTLIALYENLEKILIVPLAIGSIAALVFNFTFIRSKLFIHR